MKTLKKLKLPKLPKKRAKKTKPMFQVMGDHIVLGSELFGDLRYELEIHQEGSIHDYMRLLNEIDMALSGREEYEPFVEHLRKEHTKFASGFESRRSEGTAAFDDIPFLFSKGTEVAVVDDHGEILGGKVTATRLVHG